MRCVLPGRAVRQRVGKHTHPVGHDATERAFAAKKWPSGQVPPDVSANDDLAFGRPVTSEFCRSLFILATPKLARNQMFRARYVPNMYLFGTFSAQNPREIGPLLPPSRGTIAREAGRGNGPRASRTGRAG
jgi:hypothetical protein